jgi:signal transduction histidine kinase
VVAEKLQQLRAAYPRHRLELSVSDDVKASCDGRRLQQVLGNLVENAIKHESAEAPVRVAVIGRESDFLLEVRNSGPAIEPSMLAHMFEPLVRGTKHAAASGDQGLGLGLYIAREIAKAHGGEIEVQSDVTETVFAVRLPHR